MNASLVDTSMINTILSLDVRSYLARYINMHDMKIIKDIILIDSKLHDYIVNCGYTSQYKWMLEQHCINMPEFSEHDFAFMSPEEYDAHSWILYTRHHTKLIGNLDMLKLARAYNL